jgi:hypothetical protein
MAPAAILGAVSVVQVMPADANGNVLGTGAIATLDLSVKAPSDQAIVSVFPSSLYADGTDRRAHITVLVRDTAGQPAADGTRVGVTAMNCQSRLAGGQCIASAGGSIVGGSATGSGSSSWRVFTVTGGRLEADYSTIDVNSGVGLSVDSAAIKTVTIQVGLFNAFGNLASSTALGTTRLTLTGAASSEMVVSPDSVPAVYPAPPVTVYVHHVHDTRANLVPDGAGFLLSASKCATLLVAPDYPAKDVCVESAGGTILDGADSAEGSGFKLFALSQAQFAATYSAGGVVVDANEVKTVNLQLVMSDGRGRKLGWKAVAIAPLKLRAPSNAIGIAQPSTLLADLALHTATVTFSSIIDAYGNVVPDGSMVVASADRCARRNPYPSSACINGAGGQILNGSASPTGTGYKVFTVQNGTVTVTYADQGISADPGAIKQAYVALFQADQAGRPQQASSSDALAVVPIGLPGTTSATAVASPAVIYADGGDRRTVVTVSNVRDAAGHLVPDGTLLAVKMKSGSYGEILGGTVAGPFGDNYFPVTNGQIVFEFKTTDAYTAEKTLFIEFRSAGPGNVLIDLAPIASVSIRVLVFEPIAQIVVHPVDLFADGSPRLSQIGITGLLLSDSVTPVPDGAKVGLTASSSSNSQYPNGSRVQSLGGEIQSAGAAPGDGTLVGIAYGGYSQFTVVGGQVQAVYSPTGIALGVGVTGTARVSVVPLSSTGNVISFRALGIGAVLLRGMTSATGSGPASVPLSGGTATVTFSGIKDSAGNNVPDGARVLVTATSHTWHYAIGSYIGSRGGTIANGTEAQVLGPTVKMFTVIDGSITVQYTTAGASAGTARIQIGPADSAGSFIRTGNLNRVLDGGVFEIQVQ